jgi:hypothetical protein
MEFRNEPAAPAKPRPPAPFVPPRLTPLGRVQDITLGTGLITTTDGFFGS